MKIKLSPYAEIDLQVSINFYNEQKEKLGYEFANEVNDAFDRIKDNYEQFPRILKDMRKAKINRFPYNIFFIAETQIVYILGIFHTSRNPNIMKNRHKIKK
ncbi:MAG: type II toxin-antitoxin system RelE/ParE family toxin [Candidatus Kapabacteria bacterium]|nr:type II toxin-antitoxin system RelE/ParE family toxin [Candidatus Kapabacteria bacterium]